MMAVVSAVHKTSLVVRGKSAVAGRVDWIAGSGGVIGCGEDDESAIAAMN